MAHSRRERQRRVQKRLLATVIVVVAVAAIAGGLWWWSVREPAGEPAPGGLTDQPTLEVEPRSPGEPEPSELPELEESDGIIRQLVGRLSAHPQLAQWLANENLVRRFVLVVVDLAGRSNPAANVPFLRPQREFEVRAEGDVLTMAPASHRRYDLLVTVFESLDTEGTVETYHRLDPLIQEAYAELGIGEPTFHQMLMVALRNLQEVQLPEEPPELVDADGIYVFRDPERENLRGAEKALIRMGPENARRVQEKAADLAAELQRRGSPSSR